ncbi:MAG: serine hydrolase [Bacteroidales bacterium]|nr:serine hydrolase [Bacteroidales bacterium]
MTESCRILIHNIPDISDYKIFPYQTIKNSPESIFYFKRPETINDFGKEILVNYNTLLPDVYTLNDYVEKSKTAALIVIRNDTIMFEKYTKNYHENSIFNTFSVTKVFMTTLVGIAIHEGNIKSVDQKIIEYIPELAEKEGFNEITIKHLLLHTSGIKFTDSRFNPFSDNAKYYYSPHLRKLVLKAELFERPGVVTHYGSVNVQLLGLILERATGTTLSAYLQDNIWQIIGMQYEATWSLDNKRNNPVEKAFSNLNCTAIDLAKIGRLYLNHGVWDSTQILAKEFIYDATNRDTTAGSVWDFQYNIRFDPINNSYYYSRGLYGQLIFIYPSKNIIIVRLGEADRKYDPNFMNRVVLQIVAHISD